MDADLGQEVVIVRADVYDILNDLLREGSDRQMIAMIAMRNAIGRMNEN